MYYFCTYFDKNYLHKGLALYHSLKTHCPDFRLYILCMDDVCYQTLARMSLQDVTLISIGEFEKNDRALTNAKKNRSLIEYYFTCTPSLPLYVLNHWPEADIITYLDSDLYFFQSPKELYDEMGTQSILIIGHRFPVSIADRNIYGKYNVGYLSFRRDQYGLECLQRWREQCIEWCYDYLDGDRYAEQKYLDEWPEHFKQVAVLQHKGGGLAPWNISGYDITGHNGRLMVDDQPLIFYHFHSLKKISPQFYDTQFRTYGAKATRLIVSKLYRPYIAVLEMNQEQISGHNDGKTIEAKQIRGKNTVDATVFGKVNRFGHFVNDLLAGDLIRTGT